MGALFTWWVVVMRRGERAATGADPKTAMAARHALSRLRLSTEPAAREAARALLPQVDRGYRRARNGFGAFFALVVVVLVLAVTRRSGGLAGVAGFMAALTLLMTGIYTRQLRLFRGLERELG